MDVRCPFTGKLSYRHRSAAMVMVRRTRSISKIGGKTIESFVVYLCPFGCGMFHIAHADPERRKIKCSPYRRRKEAVHDDAE